MNLNFPFTSRDVGQALYVTATLAGLLEPICTSVKHKQSEVNQDDICGQLR